MAIRKLNTTQLPKIQSRLQPTRNVLTTVCGFLESNAVDRHTEIAIMARYQDTRCITIYEYGTPKEMILPNQRESGILADRSQC